MKSQGNKQEEHREREQAMSLVVEIIEPQTQVQCVKSKAIIIPMCICLATFFSCL